MDDTVESAPESDGEEDREEEMEYEDEEQLAVVTVVEDFNPEFSVHPAPRLSTDESGRNAAVSSKAPRPRSTKNKPKKIRYETQAARKVEKTKQRARRAEKAERAGGKRSRRSKR